MDNKLEVKMVKMSKDIEFIKRELVEIKDAIKACNRKYASKWVERAMTALIVMLVMASLFVIFDSAGLPH